MKKLYQKSTILEFVSEFRADLESGQNKLFDASNVSVAVLTALATQARPALPAQAERAILPIMESLKNTPDRSACVIGEMGVGKTQISLSVAGLMAEEKGIIALFLTAGSKHTQNMKDEAVKVLGDKVITHTLSLKAKLKKGEISPSDLIALPRIPGKVQMVFASKDAIKTSFKSPFLEYGQICVSCKKMLTTQEGKTPKKVCKTCPSCGVSTASPAVKQSWIGEGVFPSKRKALSKGQRNLPLDKTLSRLSSGKEVFDLLIVDEVHEMQNPESLQGLVYRGLQRLSISSIILTGTLSNGKTSSIFHILEAAFPIAFARAGFTYKSKSAFIQKYGKSKSVQSYRSGGGYLQKGFQELPYTREGIIPFLAPYTVWISLEDLNETMPSFSESSIPASFPEALGTHIQSFKSTAMDFLKKWSVPSRLVLAKNLVPLFNNPYHSLKVNFKLKPMDMSEQNWKTAIRSEGIKVEETASSVLTIDFDSMTGSVEFIPAGNPQEILPKEEVLVNQIKADVDANRGCLVFSIYNNSLGISDRLHRILENAFPGKTVKVLPNDISGEGTAKWLKVNGNCDILVASPKKLNTGFNLPQFPSIYVYEWADVRNQDQANRRSWRAVIQKLPVRVKYLYYTGTQAVSLQFLSAKMKAAMRVKGQKVTASSIASQFDENATETELFNALVDSVEEATTADMSSIIEPGKNRPSTELELKYMEEVRKVRPLDVSAQIESEISEVVVIEEPKEIVIPAEIKSEEKNEEPYSFELNVGTKKTKQDNQQTFLIF